MTEIDVLEHGLQMVQDPGTRVSTEGDWEGGGRWTVDDFVGEVVELVVLCLGEGGGQWS